MSESAGSIKGELILGVGGWTSNLKKSLSDTKSLGETIKKEITESGKGATSSVTRLSAVLKSDLVQGGSAARASITSLNSATIQAGQSYQRTAHQVAALAAELRQVKSASDEATQSNSRRGFGLGGLLGVAGGAAAIYAAGRAAKDFTVDSLRLAAANEQTAISFEVMLGSAEKASKLQQQIIAFAAATPFQLPELQDASKQLLAFGFSAEEILPTVQRLGDVSAGLKIPLGDLAYLFGTTRVQGRLYTQDLNQFIGRGIPLIQELSKQFGVAEGEVKGLVESGRVGFENVRIAIESLTSAGGKFDGLMKRLSDSAAGRWSTLKDAVEGVKRSFGQGLIGDETKDQVSEITRTFERLQPTAESVGNSLARGLKNATPLLEKFAAGIDYLTKTDSQALAESIKARSGFSKTESASNLLASGGEVADRTREAYQAAAREILNEFSKAISVNKARKGKEAIATIEAKKIRDELASRLNSGVVDADFIKQVEAGIDALASMRREIADLEKILDVDNVRRKIDPIRADLLNADVILAREAALAKSDEGDQDAADRAARLARIRAEDAAANSLNQSDEGPEDAKDRAKRLENARKELDQAKRIKLEVEQAMAETRAAILRSRGKDEEAELVEFEARWARRLAVVENVTQREALLQQKAAELEERHSRSLESARSIAEEAALLRISREQGDYAADIARIRLDIQERINAAKSEEERIALRVLEAERIATRDAEARARGEQTDNNSDGRKTDPASRLDRQREAARARQQVALDRLNKREGLVGALSEDEKARRGRLQESLGLTGMASYAGNIAAANAAALDVAAPSFSVNVPGFDMDKLAKAIAKEVSATQQKQIQQLEASAAVANVVMQVAGGLM